MWYHLKPIYEDQDLLAINKPSGLLSIPDRFDRTIPSAKRILETTHSAIYTIHRIDKATSGLLIFAKNPVTHRQLSLLFENRKVIKRYIVLVSGKVDPTSGIIDMPIGKSASKAGKMKLDTKGKSARTTFNLREQFESLALVGANIHTGRTHQIRLHFPHAGMPLAFDPLYGNSNGVMLSAFKRNFRPKKGIAEKPLLNRLSLHSWKLEFEHPSTEKNIVLEAELPKDFKALLNQLRKKWIKNRMADQFRQICSGI